MIEIELVHDCGRCAALCCVAMSFEASEDFAESKAAGERCRHLTARDRCALHASLAVRGFAGCAAFGCHGAGQSVTARFPDAPQAARNEVFRVLRVIHELLFLVEGARRLCPSGLDSVARDLERVHGALQRAARGDVEETLALAVDALHRDAHAALRALGAGVGGRRALVVVSSARSVCDAASLEDEGAR